MLVRAATGPRPPGFRYISGFLGPDEQSELIRRIARIELEDVRMHGVVARRKVAHFGYLYAYDSARIQPGPPLPESLMDLRARSATLLDTTPEMLAEILVSCYAPGAGIGWHRDAPAFARLVGVSLGSECVLRFRRKRDAGWERFAQRLEPGSAYVIAGEARTAWQHGIPPVAALRYSVTFRTLRRDEARLAS